MVLENQMDGVRFQAESPLTDTPATRRTDLRAIARIVINRTLIGSVLPEPIVRGLNDHSDSIRAVGIVARIHGR